MPIKSIEKFTDDINDSLIVLKEKNIYNKLTEKSFEKINNLDKKADIDKLVFKNKGNTPDEDFSKFDNVLYLINKIKDVEISLNEAKGEQIKLRSDTVEIKTVRKKHLLKESREARTSIENVYNARKKLLLFLMNILQGHLKLDVKQKKQQDLKY